MRTLTAFSAIAMFAVSTVADAQWVLLARRAVGRVEQMSQQSPQPNGPSYDSAAVMLEAPADKVFAAVVNGLRNKPDLRIAREDPAARLVQFSNGRQIAGIKVAALGDELTHMLISSAHTGNEPDAAALVLNAVLRVCKDMNVECSQAAN
jgi:hypothetical protein